MLNPPRLCALAGTSPAPVPAAPRAFSRSLEGPRPAPARPRGSPPPRGAHPLPPSGEGAHPLPPVDSPGGGLWPSPRGSPPCRRSGLSSGSGAVACRRRGQWRASRGGLSGRPGSFPRPRPRGREVLRAAGSGRTPGGSSRPRSPPRAPSGRAARRGTPPTARGSAGLLAAFGSPVQSSVGEETTGNDRPSQPARHRRPPAPAIPAAQLAAREPSGRGLGCPGRRASGSLLETPLLGPRRRPVPGRRCCRRPGRPPFCPASPYVGRSPRAPRSGKPGTFGNSQDPAAFCFHGSGVSENAFVFFF